MGSHIRPLRDRQLFSQLLPRIPEHVSQFSQVLLLLFSQSLVSLYISMVCNPELLEQRRRDGRPEQPAAVVVSRSPDFSQDWLFFQQPLRRWLLAPAPVEAGFERWIPLGDSWLQRLEALGSAGMERLVLLGGAHLVADLLSADCVDALQLTLVPKLLGGANTWLPSTFDVSTEGLAERDAWCSEGAEPLGDGEWLLRYRRKRVGIG